MRRAGVGRAPLRGGRGAVRARGGVNGRFEEEAAAGDGWARARGGRGEAPHWKRCGVMGPRRSA
eukprot:1121332-Prymnesium_polylepis.1